MTDEIDINYHGIYPSVLITSEEMAISIPYSEIIGIYDEKTAVLKLLMKNKDIEVLIRGKELVLLLWLINRRAFDHISCNGNYPIVGWSKEKEIDIVAITIKSKMTNTWMKKLAANAA